MGVLKKILEIQENEGFEEGVTKTIEITEKEYDDVVHMIGRSLLRDGRRIEDQLVRLSSQMYEKERNKAYPNLEVTYSRTSTGVFCSTRVIGPAGFHRNLKKDPPQITEIKLDRFIGLDD